MRAAEMLFVLQQFRGKNAAGAAQIPPALPTLSDCVLEQRSVSYARFSPQSYLILSSVLSFWSYSH